MLQFDDQELDLIYEQFFEYKAYQPRSFPPEDLEEATISESSDGAEYRINGPFVLVEKVCHQ